MNTQMNKVVKDLLELTSQNASTLLQWRGLKNDKANPPTLLDKARFILTESAFQLHDSLLLSVDEDDRDTRMDAAAFLSVVSTLAERCMMDAHDLDSLDYIYEEGEITVKQAQLLHEVFTKASQNVDAVVAKALNFGC